MTIQEKLQAYMDELAAEMGIDNYADDDAETLETESRTDQGGQ